MIVVMSEAAQTDLDPPAKEIFAVLREVHKGSKRALIDMMKKYPNFHWSQIVYNQMGDSALHIAAKYGFLEIIDYLSSIDTPSYVDCKNRDDKTALHVAAQFSQYEASKRLLQHGANVNALKKADWTPLMLACTKITKKKSLKVVKLLLDNGAIINYKNKDGWTALHLIAREGDIEIFYLLLKYNVDVAAKTTNGRTALHIAALHGHIDIVDTLLNLELNVNEKDCCGNTPLHEAVLGRHIDICKVLIENKADIHSRNYGEYSIIHLAASEGYSDVIEFILNNLKFNVNDINKDGLTALHCAARRRQKDAYEFLIKNGADVNIRDSFNRLPVDYLNLK